MDSGVGKILILIGLGILLVGIVIYFFHQKFQWFGHLPGDIRIERENFKFYFPLVSMILISVLVNLVIYLFKKLQ